MPITALLEQQQGAVRWRWLLAAVIVVAALVAMIPGRTAIPPLVESDYCYLLTAADRLHAGHGPTATPPAAPFQPWQWRGDWVLLTQWPIGYPLMVAGTRGLLGVGTIDACRWIAVFACAASLVGWFAWIRRCVPTGGTGILLALLAAGGSVSVASLINPSTDAIVVAAVPFVLLLASDRLRRCPRVKHASIVGRATGARSFVAPGFAAGSLFWIRYAAIFVPVSIGAALLIMRFVRRYGRFRSDGHPPSTGIADSASASARTRIAQLGDVSIRHGAAFAFGAALPIASLLIVDRAFGLPQPLQAQLNLGHAVGMSFTWRHVATAWRRWTDLGFYDYHAAAPLVYALWPLALVVVVLLVRRARRDGMTFLFSPAVMLSAATALTALAMLVAVTTVFGGKYDFVNLDRYYVPIRPLYLALFAAPVLLIPRRAVRVVVSVALLVGCSWIVQQEWTRTYRRWQRANRPVTPSGAWARAFGPDAADLYNWLREHSGDDLVMVSNFHEYVALETGIPAVPIPPDRAALRRWVRRIAAARRVERPRVLFVLDPNNGDRGYWIPDPSRIIRDFDLRPVNTDAPNLAGYVFAFPLNPGEAIDGRT